LGIDSSGISSPGITPRFLGFAERCPRIQVRPRYSPVFVDIGGAEVPFDLVKQGSDAIVSADLTYFNYQTFLYLQQYTSEAGTVPGDLGTLMMTEQGISQYTGFPLWMPFYYSQKPAMNTESQGYHFLSAMCANDDLAQMGTLPQRKRLIFHCVRGFTLGNLTAYGQGYFSLFDFDMSKIAGLSAA
jgi:hypothetical protein